MSTPHRTTSFGILLISAAALLAAVPADAPPATHAFALTYTARVTAVPPTAARVDVWVPLATSRDGQDVRRRTVRAPVPYTIQQEPEYGNELLHLTLQPPFPAELVVDVDYDVTVAERPMPTTAPAAAEPATSLERHLAPHALVVLDDRVRQLAREATLGYDTPLAQARGIYEYVVDYMRYDKETPGWGRGDVQRACELAAGNCTDFHSLFIAMARASGIPARFKMGLTVPREGEGLIAGYHCWAEFHTPETGWVPVDASEAWKQPTKRAYYFGTHDPEKFLLTVGRDLTLAPAQQGGPVNLLIHPYVEVDGAPFMGAETQFRFTHHSTPQEAL